LHVVDKFGVRGATTHGVARLLSWWFARWDRSRFDCRLIGLREFDSAAQFLIDEGLSLACLGKGKFDPTTLPALMRVIRDEKIELVHLHGYGAANFGRLAARWAGIPAIVHEHAVFPSVPGYQRIADRLLAPSTRVGIAVSRSVLEFMATVRRIPRDRLRVIENGAPLAHFTPASAAVVAETRVRWGLAGDRPVIGAIGRLGEQKGLVYLVRTLPTLARRGMRPTLVLVGDGDQEATLRAEAASLGVADQVVFTGFASDTRAIQSVLDVQVFPSLFEGTPLTVFEAMAMGRTIVSTWVDGLGETLSDGETALLTPPRDSAALADALTRVLADRDLAGRLAANAKAASAGHEIQGAVDAIQAAYAEIIDPAGPRRAAA
jgi:glycosyltransferase involved in cell wall biosynthesis